MSRILVVSASVERACRIERTLLDDRSVPGTGPQRHATRAFAKVVMSTAVPDALGTARNGRCDLVLVDAADPAGDPFALCRTLKTFQLPVVVLTDPNSPWQRLLALDAGADELAFLETPHADLLRRLRSVMTLKGLIEEYGRTATLLGLAPEPNDRAIPAAVLLADPDSRSRDRLSLILAGEFRVDSVSDPDLALRQAAAASYDVAIVSKEWPDQDGQVLARHVRTLDRRRSLCVVALADQPWELEEPADDLITRPVDRCEAIVRVRIMARRSRLCSLCRGDDGILFGWGAGRTAMSDFRLPPDRFAA